MILKYYIFCYAQMIPMAFNTQDLHLCSKQQPIRLAGAVATATNHMCMINFNEVCLFFSENYADNDLNCGVSVIHAVFLLTRCVL